MDAETEKMFVSINTDDLGVFDTTLENEYALMACALDNALNAQGEHAYKSSDIYDWIDRIREMGLEQSFKLSREKLKGVESCGYR